MTAGAGRVLVLGGGGFIGRAISHVLAERGWDVIVADRGSGAAVCPPGARHVVMDRAHPDECAAVLRSLTVEAMVDVCAYQPRDLAPVLAAMRGRLRLGLHIGSLSSYRPPLPVPVPESWPLRDGAGASESAYGTDKAACERVLAAHPANQAPWCRLRLPAVMAPGEPHSREAAWLAALRRRRPLVIPGGCDWLLHAVLAADIGRVCADLLEVPDGLLAGTALNVAGPPVTLRHYLERLAALAGEPGPALSAGPPAQGAQATDWPHAHGTNVVLDTARLAAVLPAFRFTPLDESLCRVIQAITPETADGGAWSIPAIPAIPADQFNPIAARTSSTNRARCPCGSSPTAPDASSATSPSP